MDSLHQKTQQVPRRQEGVDCGANGGAGFGFWSEATRVKKWEWKGGRAEVRKLQGNKGTGF